MIAFQAGKKADGGLESLTQLIERYHGVQLTLLSQAETAKNLRWQRAGGEGLDPLGSEPGWLGVVVARGELKQWIDSTPIEDRPNRPFHFYGNTVRRKYYRGAATARVAI